MTTDRVLILRLNRAARVLDAALVESALESSAGSRSTLPRHGARVAAVIGAMCLAISIGLHSRAESVSAAIAVPAQTDTQQPTFSVRAASTTLVAATRSPSVTQHAHVPPRQRARDATAVGTTAPMSVTRARFVIS